MSAEEAVDLADHIDSRARELLPQDVALQTSGIGLLAARIGPRALRSALKGLLAALCLIAVLIAVLFRSLRVGLLSLVPNLLPVAIGVFAVASSFEQVDLDTVNMLAVCLGIAVDDTIHFLARYRIERRNGASRPGAIEATILEAGHGILRTSLILTCGFAVMMLSDYQPVAHIGMMLPAVLAAAVILDLTLVPALARLGLLEPRRSSS